MRTEPVKYSAGPFREGCELLRVIFIVSFLCSEARRPFCAAIGLTLGITIARLAVAARMRLRVIMKEQPRDHFFAKTSLATDTAVTALGQPA